MADTNADEPYDYCEQRMDREKMNMLRDNKGNGRDNGRNGRSRAEATEEDRSHMSELTGDYQDLRIVDETYIDERVEAAAQPNILAQSTLEDVVHAIRREEGESTDAMLARLFARALLNEQPRSEVPLYHVIPDLSKNIENFTGDEKGVRSKDWINNIESMRRIHKLPENFALETARMHLRGGARDWYRARASTLVSWKAFKLAFENTFIVPESTTDRW